jgi:hypothetical protein
MARQGISTGFAPNDGNGDTLIDGAIKVNSNFSEIYSTFGDGATLVSYVNNAGVSTVSGYSTSSGVSTVSGYATIAGYSTSSGVSTVSGYATIAGYSTSSGVSTVSGYATIAGYSTSSGISTYATSSGISTYATSSGISTYATSSGISTYATIAGYSTSSGVSTSSGYATIAGYSTSSGISTQSTKLQNLRTFEITGDIVGAAVTFDGTQNVSIAATIQPNSVALGSDTTGDYVQSISGTSNQISVSATSGEGSTPTLSLPSNLVIPQDATVTRDLQVNRNLNVTGNITIGGTSATLFSQTLNIFDPDIVLGYRTDGSGNDISNDTTSNHGGVALASTEGTPLVDLFIAGIETNPATYKKIMWFKSGSFAGLNTDAWLINYGVGIGSTQVPNGVRLAVGGVQVTDTAVTAATFSGNATTATTAGYATTAGISTISQGLTGTPSINVYNVGVASAINVAAASTFQSSVHFESTLLIGEADELQIFHDGNNSYIDNSSAGNLIIRDSGTGIQLKKTSGALMGVFNNDAGVELYYDGVLKFQTFQNGVAINDSVGIGTTAGNPPYRLTVSGVGATITSGLANAIADFTSSVNGYGQLNVRNSLSGTNASGDIVVTANSGNDTSNFIDLGINNVGFTTTSWTINGALDGYLYTSDGNLSIGAASASKYLSLFAGGTLAANEQVRVTTTGVGIGTTNPTSKLTVTGDVLVSGITTTARLNVGTGGTVITTTVAGSVGIGTTNPTNTLTVYGPNATIRINDTANNASTTIAYGSITLNGNGVIQQIGNTQYFRAGQNGSSSYYFDNYYSGSSHELFYIDTNGSIRAAGDAKITGITTTARLNVGTGGTVITTTAAGLVGVGITDPQTRLEISGVLGFTGNNIKIGNVSTGSSIAFGSGNFFAGPYAGNFTTDGFNNNFVGSSAGLFNITGSDNNFFGYSSGYNNTTGYGNNFFGYAGYANTTGSNNNFFGFGAGNANTSGSDNIYIGQATGNANVTGSENVIIGKGQNAPILNGSNQLVIGAGSTSWITGNSSYNVGIGTTNPQTKLEVNGVLGFTGGVYGGANIKIGNVSTGSSITYANDNVFIGNDAGKYTTYGSLNLFVGSYAGSNNISGSHNNFLGENAGVSNIDGSYNNCFGQYAGYSNSSGILNNFIGISAGQSNTTGSDNIYLGTNAGNANVTGSENVIIGKGRNAPILNGSNQLVIGAGSTSWITGNRSYNVGIGTTNPGEKLDVSGNIKLSSPGSSILNSSGRKILNQTGGILQVVHTEYTTATALGCAALTDVSGFSTSITPSSTSSKVLVMVHFSGVLDCDGRLNLKVGGSVVKANLVGSDRFANASGGAGVNNYNDAATYCATYLHSPASTSALTYQIAVQCGGCSQTAYFNRDPSNSTDNGRSGITLMEVSG